MSDNSPMPVAASGGAGTRERILRAASELFSRMGFARVSMRLVAIEAGVTKPALYYHFRDKAALYEECLSDFNDELTETMQQAAHRNGSPSERVRAVAETLLSGSPFHPVRVHEELVEQASAELRERLRDTFTSVVVDPVTHLFAELQAEGELRDGVRPADAAAMLIGACMAFLPPPNGNGDAWAPLPATGSHLPAPSAAATVTDLVLRGLAATA
jgi:AcrR family transcriptional regulator